MRAHYIVFLITCMVVTGCRHHGVRGSGIERSEERSLDEFTVVDISGTFKVTIRCGESPGARVTADDNLLHLIKTEVRGSKLHIFPEREIDPRASVKVEVTTPGISEVSVSGVASIDIRKVESEKLSLEISGAASVAAEGTVHDADFAISGAGKLSTEDLHAANLRVTVSGAAKADVYASESLDVDVAGAGTVRYAGNPKNVKKNISGVGFVSQK